MKNVLTSLYAIALVAVVLLTVWVLPPALSLGFLIGLSVAIVVALTQRYKVLVTALVGLVGAFLAGFALHGSLYATDPAYAQFGFGIISILLLLLYVQLVVSVKRSGWLSQAKPARKRKPTVLTPPPPPESTPTPPGAE